MNPTSKVAVLLLCSSFASEGVAENFRRDEKCNASCGAMQRHKLRSAGLKVERCKPQPILAEQAQQPNENKITSKTTTAQSELFEKLRHFTPVKSHVTFHDGLFSTDLEAFVERKVTVNSLWRFVLKTAHNPPHPLPMGGVLDTLITFSDSDGNRHIVSYDTDGSFTIDTKITGYLSSDETKELTALTKPLMPARKAFDD